MTITFQELTFYHFPLLLKWLETPHVKTWWDSKIVWTKELIEKKYKDYVNGKNSIKAYIVYVNDQPIGYIQYYNKYDFPREHDYAVELPESCAAIDWYIGEPDFIGQGFGTKALSEFLQIFVFNKFDNVFVDPDTANKVAIRSYEKVGFNVLEEVTKCKVTLMLKNKHV